MMRRILDFIGITRPAGSKLYPAGLYATVGLVCIIAAIVGFIFNLGIVFNLILILLAIAMFIVFVVRKRRDDQVP